MCENAGSQSAKIVWDQQKVTASTQASIYTQASHMLHPQKAISSLIGPLGPSVTGVILWTVVFGEICVFLLEIEMFRKSQ